MNTALIVRSLGTALLLLALPLSIQAQQRSAKLIDENTGAEDMVRHLIVEANPSNQTAQEVSLALPVNFEFNSARLTVLAQTTLRQVAMALNDPVLVGHSFLVEGHTDIVGSDSVNQTLSERRARSAFDYLVALGVARERLRTVGYGKERLLAGIAPTDGRNRRIEILRLP